MDVDEAIMRKNGQGRDKVIAVLQIRGISQRKTQDLSPYIKPLKLQDSVL